MPTFATSPDNVLPKRQHQSGFTLVELLVVLAIGAMLVGLVPVAFNKLHEGSQYRDTVRAIVSDLRQARQQAVVLGQTVVYQVDLTQRQFGVLGQPPRQIPGSLEIKTVVGQLDTLPPDGVARIVFLPEGGATGGTIELVRASGAGVRIRVDWLLGQITQEPRT
ncbi:GspH/FimT family pseudopilin [Rhodoferax sp.]|uniref:GspH/FimT family pseudopilin n=1 Tax=Rhodoferax sp. TaxID=50421 RepID=UPI00261A67D9|nr:GspH/FimT family pseudopilin [Rhodoferax sp.]